MDASSMEMVEVSTHSFILRIWLEETANDAGQAMWRGYITHIPGGERHYVKSLKDITAFIVPWLVEMGVEPGLRWRLRHRLKRWLS